MRIINKILENVSIYESDDPYNPFISFEFFPPRDFSKVDDFKELVKSLKIYDPLFVSITWKKLNFEQTINVCSQIIKELNLDSIMHLTCINMKESEIKTIIDKASDNRIENILALRGDIENGQNINENTGDFDHASDLVKFIRKNYENKFTICGTAYPECYSVTETLEENFKHLKGKVEINSIGLNTSLGSDFLITQFFYDTKYYFDFISNCKRYGINCPIIPGILPIQSYKIFKFIQNLGNVKIPQHITEFIELNKDNEEIIFNFGINLTIEMCKDLIKNKVIGLHFYTMNSLGAIEKILENINK